jgi:hypothetical protein
VVEAPLEIHTVPSLRPPDNQTLTLGEGLLDELCKGHPEEFREFMNYCRKLQFTEDPDYKYVLGLFEGCMKKNGWDPKVPDFIWNKNRLVLEKEALKQNLMKVINKPIKKLE